MRFHNDSKSHTKLQVWGGSVAVTTRVQSLSLIEQRPGLDADGDGFLDPVECQAETAWIVDYLARGMHLTGAEGDPATLGVQVQERVVDGFGFDQYQWVEVTWTQPMRSEVGPVDYSLDWFLESSPGHRDLVELHPAGNMPNVYSVIAGSGPITVELRLAREEQLGFRIDGVTWLSGMIPLLAICLVLGFGTHAKRLHGALFAALVGAFLGACFIPWEMPGLGGRIVAAVVFGYGILDLTLHSSPPVWWPSLLWGAALGVTWWSELGRAHPSPWALAISASVFLASLTWAAGIASRRMRVGTRKALGRGLAVVGLAFVLFS